MWIHWGYYNGPGVVPIRIVKVTHQRASLHGIHSTDVRRSLDKERLITHFIWPFDLCIISIGLATNGWQKEKKNHKWQVLLDLVVLVFPTASLFNRLSPIMWECCTSIFLERSLKTAVNQRCLVGVPQFKVEKWVVVRVPLATNVFFSVVSAGFNLRLVIYDMTSRPLGMCVFWRHMREYVVLRCNHTPWRNPGSMYIYPHQGLSWV